MSNKGKARSNNEIDKSIYYNIYDTLSHNCLFNMVMGNRGSGKSYSAKMWAINDFIKNGNQFAYVRRFKTELNKISKFFDDIKEEFPDHTFAVKGWELFIDDQQAGQCFALTTAKIEKSNPFPRVTKIIFDEFVLDEKGNHHYLKDEVVMFLELYETIARMRDVRVVMLANSITMINPYTIYFNMELPYGKLVYKKNDVLLQLVQNDRFIKAKKQTRFGKMISGTRYGDYAIENKFLRDNKTFIKKKSGNVKFYFSFIYQQYKIGIWTDFDEGLMYASWDIDPYSSIQYSLTLDDLSPNIPLLKRLNQSIIFSQFVKYFKNGCVYFEDLKLKKICFDVVSTMSVI